VLSSGGGSLAGSGWWAGATDPGDWRGRLSGGLARNAALGGARPRGRGISRQFNGEGMPPRIGGASRRGLMSESTAPARDALW